MTEGILIYFNLFSYLVCQNQLELQTTDDFIYISPCFNTTCPLFNIVQFTVLILNNLSLVLILND